MKKLLVFLMSAAGPFFSAAQTPDTSEYRASYPKINDLVHVKLDARFDFATSHLAGKVWITLKPHFYPTDSLQLDAKGMDVAKVSLVKGSAMNALKFNNTGWYLKIKLDREYKAGESYTVYIEYTAKPNEVKVQGSAAINDAKGLYFINPKGEEKNKPTQVWTQGETEGTSVWLPIIDKPNQKATEEIIMTVPDKFVTLSNGKLVGQKKNADGTRTDDWKMELPHSPYLFFMGAGDFAVVKDKYDGKEVSYYVEKEYASTARKIFGATPAMIAYFEKLTGVRYPWVKYSQMVARDYVSGAMENTTCTLHQESAQQDARELVDGNGWESIIAHELFHQWFGDYVTCESWSNLTMNESFADYSQYLWKEHRYGADAAGEENYQEMLQYLGSPAEASKHLVRFHYGDKEEMFDLVSYQKGGRVLNMLRNYLGDSAFFKGCNLYLTTNKFRNGEAHQWRIALEDVSGKDLNWFFDQWYFGSGHPKVTISYTFDEAARKVGVTISQSPVAGKVFTIPLAIDIYEGNKKTRHQVLITNAKETFTFGYSTKPDLINADAEKMMLWEKTDTKTLDNLIFQYSHAGNYVDRREAIVGGFRQLDNPKSLTLIKSALKDKFEGLRVLTIERLDTANHDLIKMVEPVLFDLAKNDKKSTVRAKAIEVLAGLSKKEYRDLFAANLNDSSYSVAGASLEGLSLLDREAALAESRKLMLQPSKGKLARAITAELINNGAETDFDFIAGKYGSEPVTQSKFETTALFAVYLARVEDTGKVKQGVDLIVGFREAIPQQYRGQTDGPINQMILGTLMTGKEASGHKEQANYIKSKLP